MIISRGRRFIFVHAPKTGGTALALALEERAMKDDILIGDTPKAINRRRRQKNLKGAGKLWKHSRISDIRGVLSDAEISEFFVVMLVRNPWDRMVSYYHWLRSQTWEHESVELSKSLVFNDFVQHRHIKTEFTNGGYTSYVTDHRGHERCDAFVRIEHFSADIAHFEAHIGYKIGHIEHINRSVHRPDYRGYYCDESAATVAAICRTDVTRFGYAF